ncbi:MAG TPA: MerR family DNA-binding protein [Burkholderiaceae bacterium]|nr:MerR family DNA-binding protein [Burkholderiaceae bacterium]
MPESYKQSHGHHRYAVDTVKRVHFIRRTQVLAFTLEEIRSLLELDGVTPVAIRANWPRKIGDDRNHLADLTAMREALTTLLRPVRRGAMKGTSRSAMHWLQAEAASRCDLRALTLM